MAQHQIVRQSVSWPEQVLPRCMNKRSLLWPNASAKRWRCTFKHRSGGSSARVYLVALLGQLHSSTYAPGRRRYPARAAGRCGKASDQIGVTGAPTSESRPWHRRRPFRQSAWPTGRKATITHGQRSPFAVGQLGAYHLRSYPGPVHCTATAGTRRYRRHWLARMGEFIGEQLAGLVFGEPLEAPFHQLGRFPRWR